MRISDWSSDVCSSDLSPVHHAAPVTVAAANAAVAVAPPVKQQPVIKRGDPIVVAAGSPGFSISREAIAMGNAAPGERFLAKGDGDTTQFQAIAVAPGRATLPGWADQRYKRCSSAARVGQIGR